MPKNKRDISTSSWPGVLDEIDIKVIPVEYVKNIEVHFDNGTVWLIDVDPEESKDSIDLEESIESLIEEYEDTINGVNFVLDVEKVKKDITQRTKHFMKKRR